MPDSRSDTLDAARHPLDAAEVVVRYGGVTALDRAGLSVRRGECVALVGESGSGKTTLLRCFNGLVSPDAGSVRVRGERIDAHAARGMVRLRRSMGYVPQSGGLLPHWRVARNVELVPTLLGDADPAGRARRALDRVGLDPDAFGRRWPRTLSGGQRQRVALARALAAEPDIILLDEPLGALDALSRGELRSELTTLIRGGGVTVLLVTHDLAEAEALADRIAVMREGRVLQVAPMGDLVDRPAHPYVTELLGRARIGGFA
jgi:osmoprotectant transport system ATP-binding protein